MLAARLLRAAFRRGAAPGGADYETAVLDDAPQSYWPLDDVGATVVDTVGTNDGTWINTDQSAVAGLVTGSAAAFHGSAGFTTANLLDNPSAYTQEALIQTDQTDGGTIFQYTEDQTGASTSRQRELVVTGSTLKSVTYTGSDERGVSCVDTITPGRVYHVAAAVDGTVRNVYVNGLLSGAANFGDADSLGYWRLSDGKPRSGYYSKSHFDGVLDNPAVYTKALDAAAVWRHAKAAGLVSGTFLPVVNPSGFDGTSGWTDTLGTLNTRNDPNFVWENTAEGRAHQDISVPAERRGTGASARVTWLQGSYTREDAGEIVLSALDSAGSVVASTASGLVSAPGGNQYARYNATLDLPGAAAAVRIEMHGFRHDGSNLDAYFRGISCILN